MSPAAQSGRPEPAKLTAAQMAAAKEKAPHAIELAAHDHAKGYVRAHRDAVVHVTRRDQKTEEILQVCPVTILPADHAEMHARSPGFLATMRCAHCRLVAPVSEFVWHEGGERCDAEWKPPVAPAAPAEKEEYAEDA
jgi:hypothetical protein